MVERGSSAGAIGALIWKDPERILAMAAQLRGSGAALECRLRGASMAPAIPPGASIRIAVDEGAGVGDVVAFVRPDGLCVHRVAWLHGAQRITQGDACYLPDLPIDASRVVGRVSAWREAAGEWQPVGTLRRDDRAGSAPGRALRAVVAASTSLDPRLGRGVASLLRVFRESAPNAAAP